MGADLLLAYLPAIRITTKRRHILHQLVDNLSEAEVNDDDLLSLSDDEEVRPLLHRHVDLLPAKAWTGRDVVRMRLPHMPYPLMFTGGSSWGDSPCELFDPFYTLGTRPSIWVRLQQWARDDGQRRRERRKARRGN